VEIISVGHVKPFNRIPQLTVFFVMACGDTKGPLVRAPAAARARGWVLCARRNYRPSSFRWKKKRVHYSIDSCPPSNVYLVCPEPLRTRCFRQGSDRAHAEAKESSLCNHDSVVDTEPFICRENASTSFSGHDTHHVL
jgi:hypothetical protein